MKDLKADFRIRRGFVHHIGDPAEELLFLHRAELGIRMNATMPSPTSTPMMGAFEEVASAHVLRACTAPTFRNSTPEEQAWPLILLNSDAAAFVSGVCLPVDGGFLGGVNTGEIDLGALIRAPADAMP